MLALVPNVLTDAEIQRCRTVLEEAAWIDGNVTSGAQAAHAKKNLQIPEGSPAAQEAGELILRALGRHGLFNSAALPLRVLPPMFNRYDTGMRFDPHVDGAIRQITGANMRMRADVSSTLFLTPPEDYDGGELIIADTYGTHSVKLSAGHMVVYPSTSLHSVTEITRGSRWSSFFWTQSIVKDDGKRTQLFELDLTIMQLRQQLSDENASVISLTNHYHNLLRRWAEI